MAAVSWPTRALQYKCTFFIGNPVVKRSLGSYTRKREDRLNIKGKINKMQECVCRINQAQDRIQ
jgi:hypothetical protein